MTGSMPDARGDHLTGYRLMTTFSAFVSAALANVS
jgi:hypothetical protein